MQSDTEVVSKHGIDRRHLRAELNIYMCSRVCVQSVEYVRAKQHQPSVRDRSRSESSSSEMAASWLRLTGQRTLFDEPLSEFL